MRALALIALLAATPLFAQPAPVAPDPAATAAPGPHPWIDRGFGRAGADALAGFLCTGDSQPLDPHASSTAVTSSFGRQGDFVGAALHLPF